MQLVYAPEEPPETYAKAIYLAGPSPRKPSHPNWRKDALEILERINYDGVVFVPLPRDNNWSHSYDAQVAWETQNLDRADQIVFWVPRDMKTLPSLTTNVEWGHYYQTGRVLLGYPKDAPSMRYLDKLGKTEFVPTFNTLNETLTEAVRLVNASASPRTGGERDVPAGIWKLPQFQGWYQAQKAAGNRLEAAKVLWIFRVGKNKSYTFSFVLHVQVFIGKEGRIKSNEFILSRTDVATIVGYRKGNPECYPGRQGAFFSESLTYLKDTEIAIIKEFRSPARTKDGFIRETPGGSSWKEGDDPFTTMTHELEEETGLGAKSGFAIDPKRLRKIGSRQLCGTLSTHQAHVFACELTATEMDYLKLQQMNNTVHGVEADTERTYVEVWKLQDLLRPESNLVDWSMLGQILTTLVG